MTRTSARLVVVAGIGLAMALACNNQHDLVTAPRGRSIQKTTSTPVLSEGVWRIGVAECIHCHSTSPFPAGIDLTSRRSVLPQQVQQIYDGVLTERAPAVGAPLARAAYDSILRWAVMNGARPWQARVPATYSWTMRYQLSGAGNLSYANSAGRFFGFRIEDLGRADSLLVEAYLDPFGQHRRGLALFEQTPVNRDSFVTSTHPVNYIAIDNVPWNGRWKQMTFSGYVVVDRWAFVTFHTKMLKKGRSPYTSRQLRDYVRLQIDRDWMSWRSKVPPADGIETYPWLGPDRILTASPGRALSASTRYLRNDKWYRVDGSIRVEAGVMRYVATLSDPVTGATICSVGADRQNPASAYGSVTFGKYSQSGGSASNPKKTRFADWSFQVTEMQSTVP